MKRKFFTISIVLSLFLLLIGNAGAEETYILQKAGWTKINEDWQKMNERTNYRYSNKYQFTGFKTNDHYDNDNHMDIFTIVQLPGSKEYSPQLQPNTIDINIRSTPNYPIIIYHTYDIRQQTINLAGVIYKYEFGPFKDTLTLKRIK
jgi:hypothetical protein